MPILIDSDISAVGQYWPIISVNRYVGRGLLCGLCAAADFGLS